MGPPVQGRLQRHTHDEELDRCRLHPRGAADGHGAGTEINRMDARGIAVHALSLASSEEAERPFFFRFWRLLPPKGEMVMRYSAYSEAATTTSTKP